MEEETFEDDENVEETTDDHQEKSLYHGARITRGVNLLLIITFAIRHQLSGTAWMDLLTLIDIHLSAPNCFTRSLATPQKFFEQLENSLQFHFNCSFCYEYIGINKRTCCANKHCLQDLTKKSSLSYLLCFILIPLDPQLEALLAGKYLKEKLLIAQH